MAKAWAELKKGHPWYGFQKLTSSIYEVNVLLPFVGQRSAVQHATLAVVENGQVRWEEVGDQGRDAYTQIDIGAILQLLATRIATTSRSNRSLVIVPSLPVSLCLTWSIYGDRFTMARVHADVSTIMAQTTCLVGYRKLYY